MYIDSWITLLCTWTIVSQLYFNYIYIYIYIHTHIHVCVYIYTYLKDAEQWLSFFFFWRFIYKNTDYTAARTKDSGTKIFATISHNPFKYKKSWIINWVRWFFGVKLVHHLGQLDFWIKLLFHNATACLWIYCSVMWWAGWTWSL